MAFGDLRDKFRNSRAVRQQRQQKIELLDLKIKQEKLADKEDTLKREGFLDFVSQLKPTPGAPQQQGPSETIQQEQALAPVAAKPGQTILQALSTPQGQEAALRSGRLNIQQLASIGRKSKQASALTALTGDQSNLNIDPVSLLVAQQTGDITKLKSGKVITKDIDTPQGTRTIVFDRSGKKIADLGKPKKELSPEQAAKVQQFKTARAQLPEIENLLFKEDQSGKRVIDDQNVINMTIKTPFTKGRKLAALYETGIQAITRGETGAAMPPEEVENTRIRFQPSPLDDEETKILKFDMFKEFLDGTLKLLSPDGKFLDTKFSNELAKRRKKKPSLSLGKGNDLPAGSTLIGTSKGKPVYQAPDGKQYIVE